MVVISGVKNASQLVLAAFFLFWKYRLRSINTFNLLPPASGAPRQGADSSCFSGSTVCRQTKETKKSAKNTIQSVSSACCSIVTIRALRQGSAFFFFCHLYLLAVQTQKACIYLSVSLVSEVAWSNENMFCTCFSVAEKKKSGKKLRLGKRFFVIDMIDTHLEFTVR